MKKESNDATRELINDIFSDCLPFKEKNLSQSFNKLKLYELLRKVPDTTMWGYAIKQAFINHREQELIPVLISQGEDNPALMKEIIGDKAFDLLTNLK